MQVARDLLGAQEIIRRKYDGAAHQIQDFMLFIFT